MFSRCGEEHSHTHTSSGEGYSDLVGRSDESGERVAKMDTFSPATGVLKRMQGEKSRRQVREFEMKRKEGRKEGRRKERRKEKVKEREREAKKEKRKTERREWKKKECK